MTHLEALAQLGVRDDTLTGSEKAKLDNDGYLPLHNIITLEQAARMRSVLMEVFAKDRTGEDGGPNESGNLQNCSGVFDICFTHPSVLAAIAHVVKEPFTTRGIHARACPPGIADQGLHCDYGGPLRQPFADDYAMCNSMWPLVDFTAENGATRVVPGSHRVCRNPEDVGVDPLAHHAAQVQLIGPVGTVFIFNSHLWHGMTPNRSDHSRFALTSFFGRRSASTGVVPHAVLTPQVSDRIPDAARSLFE